MQCAYAPRKCSYFTKMSKILFDVVISSSRAITIIYSSGPKIRLVKKMTTSMVITKPAKFDATFEAMNDPDE